MHVHTKPWLRAQMIFPTVQLHSCSFASIDKEINYREKRDRQRKRDDREREEKREERDREREMTERKKRRERRERREREREEREN